MARVQKDPNEKKYSPDEIEILITIVPRKKGESFLDFIQQFECNLQVIMQGMGTADNEMMAKLGLNDRDKAVIFSIIKRSNIKECLNFLEDKFETIKNAKGIAYTIPIDSVIGLHIYKFLTNNRTQIK